MPTERIAAFPATISRPPALRRDIVVFSTAGSLVLWWRFRASRRTTSDGRPLSGRCALWRLSRYGRSTRRFWNATLGAPGCCCVIRCTAMILARDRFRFRDRVHRHFVALSQSNKDDVMRLWGARRANQRHPQRRRPRPISPLGHSSAERARSCRCRKKRSVAIFVGHEFERKGLRVVLEALRLLDRRGARALSHCGWRRLAMRGSRPNSTIPPTFIQVHRPSSGYRALTMPRPTRSNARVFRYFAARRPRGARQRSAHSDDAGWRCTRIPARWPQRLVPHGQIRRFRREARAADHGSHSAGQMSSRARASVADRGGTRLRGNSSP